MPAPEGIRLMDNSRRGEAYLQSHCIKDSFAENEEGLPCDSRPQVPISLQILDQDPVSGLGLRFREPVDTCPLSSFAFLDLRAEALVSSHGSCGATVSNRSWATDLVFGV